MSSGTPASTLKPPVIEATSAPVVTVTLREPMVALGLMVMLAVAVVALVTVSGVDRDARRRSWRRWFRSPSW